MNHSDLEMTERWKSIPMDLKYDYQASTLGRIGRLMKDGTRYIYHQNYSSRMWRVGVIMADNRRIKYPVTTLVSRTWLGQPPEGYVAIHKNNINSDNRVSNIIYIPRSKQITFYNKYKRKSIAKIDQYGEIVEIYSTAQECGEANHFNRSAIRNRCLGRYQSILAADGYAYAYEDDTYRINHIRKKLREQYGKQRQREPIN